MHMPLSMINSLRTGWSVFTPHFRGDPSLRLYGRASRGMRSRTEARKVTTFYRGVLRYARKGVCISWSFSMTATVWAQQPTHDLTTKSLEDLMNIEVTSVSKKEERLFQTAAAVYAITQQDIRRSGLTSIPELLRMVPGLDVARIDGNKWAISARGFNGRVANKLLVLMEVLAGLADKASRRSNAKF